MLNTLQTQIPLFSVHSSKRSICIYHGSSRITKISRISDIVDDGRFLLSPTRVTEIKSLLTIYRSSVRCIRIEIWIHWLVGVLWIFTFLHMYANYVILIKKWRLRILIASFTNAWTTRYIVFCVLVLEYGWVNCLVIVTSWIVICIHDTSYKGSFNRALLQNIYGTLVV
jgi:hypothetical protein